MNIRDAKLILLILMLLALMLGLSGCGAPEKAEEEQLGAAAESSSYRSVCFGEQTFVAVGTGGRIDRISVDKMVTSLQSPVSQTLNGVAFANSRYVAVGDSGVIVVSGIDGAFQLIDAVTESDLLSVTEFGENFVAVGREGTVLTSSDGENWDELDVDVTNDFISVDSNGENCIAVTREGQVLVMKSLSLWDVLDYNEVYKDLGTTFHMRAICCCGQGYLVMGMSMDNDDVPVVFKTSDGELWTEIYLDTINNVMSNEFLPIRLNSAGVFEDQILIGADGGKLLTLTSCAECTKLTELTYYNINALAYMAEGYVLLAGDDFWFDVISSDSVRTYSIKAEQARTDQLENGAYIVDVRTAEEYTNGHIPGALHIPVDRVAEQLESYIPDKTAKIIFYCSMGGRSQTALETALTEGYSLVYNLGGLDDGVWPYEIERGSEGVFEE
ncbi:rhodanese-like domain-containing protein [Ligaoa zhengdingensis]|uniref:rhodanese-like domain-containing protein n=1 Tax=Ligaoa zhengdingensis TaxID=2763658 RepID=UPI0031BAA31D